MLMGGVGSATALVPIIAEQAIRASGMSAAALVQVPTDEILKMAGIHSIK
ncbi:hypothetical protein ACT3R7_07930 [Halomonas sp. AOP43-A1-21]